MRRFMFFSGKAVLSRTSFSLFVIGCIYLSSCEDELERGKTSTSISFTPVIQSSWGPSARTMTGTDMPQDSVSSLQGGRTSLYLHTLYTDSIALPPSDSRPDRGVLTRATPIKDVNMYESFGVSASRIPVPGAKTKLPTTSTTPQPASPTAAIRFPPPITGPVLHIK